MKIGIDARPLQAETRYRGIGKALGYFLEDFRSVLGPDDQVVFYTDPLLPQPPDLKLFKHHRVISVTSTPLGRMKYIRSVLPPFALINPKIKDIDVLLQYDAALGVPRRVPTVTMFHDLIPYLFRNQEKQLPASGLRKYKNKLAGSLYWNKYLRTLKLYRRSAHILAISASSKKDLLQFDPAIPASSVTVVHLGARPHHTDQSQGSVSAKVTAIAKHDFLLYVGGIDFRKNIVGLLQAFFELKPDFPALKLVCVGKEFGLSSQLGDLGWNKLMSGHPEYAKDVIIPGFVDDPSLSYLYDHAAAFVFPTLYEGFGLPAIEAMQAGAPVVAYDNSSLPEVAGDAALILPDKSSLAPAIRRLLTEQDLRQDLIKKGKAQAAKFPWKKTAEETLAVLRQTANN